MNNIFLSLICFDISFTGSSEGNVSLQINEQEIEYLYSKGFLQPCFGVCYIHLKSLKILVAETMPVCNLYQVYRCIAHKND